MTCHVLRLHSQHRARRGVSGRPGTRWRGQLRRCSGSMAKTRGRDNLRMALRPLVARQTPEVPFYRQEPILAAVFCHLRCVELDNACVTIDLRHRDEPRTAGFAASVRRASGRDLGHHGAVRDSRGRRTRVHLGTERRAAA